MSKYAPHSRSANTPRATSSTVCQKCLKTGHFIYECKSPRPYVSRPSRTQQLENPRVLAKLKAEGKPSVDVPQEFKDKSGTANRILEAKEKEREHGGGKPNPTGTGHSKKKARRSSPDSSSSSSESDGSDSDSPSSSSASESGSERSRERDHKRRLPGKTRRSRSRSSSNDSRGRK